MAARRVLLAGDQFVVGYRAQRQWNWLIATAFLLGKLGGGLFLVALLVDFPAGAWLGLLIGVVGKGTAHLAYLGKPARFWRAMLHPQTSWLSRGLYFMGAFAVFGAITLLLDKGSTAWEVARALALLSAALMMIYDGFVLSASPGLALWSTPLMPVLAFSYALLGGVTLSIVFGNWLDAANAVASLDNLELGLLGLNLVIVVSFIYVMFSSTPRSRRAVEVLARNYTVPFFVGVFGVGIMATALLALWFTRTDNATILTGVALGDVTGHYLLFYLLLKAGLYAPMLPRGTN
ncbi:MAG: polysulfide reductase NrfD [Chloroflexi bacterium]|nr:polysulfide reductase NrfD [Chloroflexota bacterium]